jgi:hypothetical protein
MKSQKMGVSVPKPVRKIKHTKKRRNKKENKSLKYKVH